MMDLTVLKPFCSTDTLRPVLHEPYCKAGYWYATDGRIAVRVIAEPGTPDAESRYPDAGKLGWTHLDVKEWVNMAPYDGALHEAPQLMPCDNCRGTGLCICGDCQVEHDCGLCDGTGHLDDEWDDQKMGVLIFGGRYYKIMADLPKVEVAKADIEPPNTGPALVRFRFDGGEGLVMSLSKEE